MIPLLLLIGVGLGLVVLGSGETESRARKRLVIEVPLPKFDGLARTNEEQGARMLALLKARPDANAAGADWYARHQFYSRAMKGPDGQVRYYTRQEIQSRKDLVDMMAGPDRFTDEFGRPIQGVSGNPLGVALQVVGYAAPFIPGVGPAASAALAAAIALGQGKSLKEAALAAARAAIPLGATPAFDLGVAVASGQDVDDAAKDALLAYIPGGKDAYQKGEAMYSAAKGMGL